MSSPIVLDASAGVDLVVRRGLKGDWVAAAVVAAGALHAPHHVDLEVISTLRRFVGAQELSADGGEAALAAFESLPIERYPVGPFAHRIWALRDRMTPYDAAYVALAEALDVPLVTVDLRLARAGGHRAEVLAYPG